MATKPRRFSKKTMREAIEKCVFKTQVAKSLGCSITTVTNYIKRHDDLAELYNSQRETIVDLAENQLTKEIQKGNTACIIFALKTLGKDRGYSENPQLAIQQNIQYVVPAPKEMTPEKWMEVYRERE